MLRSPLILKRRFQSYPAKFGASSTPQDRDPAATPAMTIIATKWNRRLLIPIRANMVGPPDSATRIRAFIASCHSAALCSAFGSLVMCVPASSRVTSWRPRGNEIGSSNNRFQPRSATGFDRLAQPLHGELDGLRREVAPALEFGLELLLRVFPYCSPGGRALPSEFLTDKWIAWHGRY
jgi:hypothetical protein